MLGRSLGKGETAILAVAGGVPIWLIATFVALLGLAFGSFLNVCISRLPRHESVVRPGSRCPRCRTAIRAWDNAPLLSWVLLRGKCRACGWRIPWRYPAVESATAALWLLSYLRVGLSVPGLAEDVFSFLLLGLAVMDAETLRLPDTFTLPGIGLGLVWAASLLVTNERQRWVNIGAALLWACVAGLLLLAIRWLYWLVRRREGMGLGDAKLLAMIAAWLGPALTLLTLFLGVVAAAVVGVLWIAVRGRRGAMAMRLPFGSFLCAAAIYAVFAGQPILAWYLRFFR
jgi:leader peptidase (prepilin peptidase) / N-methyltransferase